MVKVTLLHFQGLYPGGKVGREWAADLDGSSRKRQHCPSVYYTCMCISAYGLGICAARMADLSSPVAQPAAGSSLLPGGGTKMAAAATAALPACSLS